VELIVADAGRHKVDAVLVDEGDPHCSIDELAVNPCQRDAAACGLVATSLPTVVCRRALTSTGSLKETPSKREASGAISATRRDRNHSQTPTRSFSGAEAPEVSPTVSRPSTTFRLSLPRRCLGRLARRTDDFLVAGMANQIIQ
jgi:hypothetical protein